MSANTSAELYTVSCSIQITKVLQERDGVASSVACVGGGSALHIVTSSRRTGAPPGYTRCVGGAVVLWLRLLQNDARSCVGGSNSTEMLAYQASECYAVTRLECSRSGPGRRRTQSSA